MLFGECWQVHKSIESIPLIFKAPSSSQGNNELDVTDKKNKKNGGVLVEKAWRTMFRHSQSREKDKKILTIIIVGMASSKWSERARRDASKHPDPLSGADELSQVVHSGQSKFTV